MNGHFDHGKFQGEVMAKLEAIHEDFKELKGTVAGQEQRLRVVEQWRWWTLGVSSVVGIGAAKVAQAITHLL